MATFQITVKSNRIDLQNGQHLDKGDSIKVIIPFDGIYPFNLLGSDKCKELIVRKFLSEGIVIPPSNPFILQPFNWDIKKL